MKNLLQLSAVICLVIECCVALECYVCKDQDSNRDKCIKTTIQCEEHEDSCLTYINYKVPPYWTLRGDRIHYVSKDCAKLETCLASQATYSTKCKRDWYDDWTCVECCQGDLCNYYVTLGSSSVRGNVIIAAVLAAAVLIVSYWTDD